MLLIQLPTDVLLLILHNCSAEELSSLSQTCVRFAHLTRLDVIWKNYCMNKFSISSLGNHENYYCLYSKLLHRYGWMIGFFQLINDLNRFKGLLEVKYLDGMIFGNQLTIPNFSLEGKDMYRFKKNKMFEITKDQQPPKHLWGKVLFGKEVIILRHRKTIVLQSDTHFKKLPLVKKYPEALKLQNGSQLPQMITPGFYVGICEKFSSQNTNVLFFNYKDTYEVHGTRVVGPMGGVSIYVNRLITAIRFDIRHPISPSIEEQKNFDALADIKPIRTDITLQIGSDQVFHLPSDCISYGTEIWPKFPETCKARYHGHAGFISPTPMSTKQHELVHILIFNHDHVGILWIKHKALTIYRRLQDV